MIYRKFEKRNISITSKRRISNRAIPNPTKLFHLTDGRWMIREHWSEIIPAVGTDDESHKTGRIYVSHYINYLMI